MTGFYIHIPFCKKRCAYCDFYSQTDTTLTGAYVDELEREIRALSVIFPNKTVDTIYFGGGTPGLLSASEVSRLILAVKNNFKTDLKEVTLEVNPASANTLDGYRRAGVDRLSVGVQSLNDRTLRAVGRLHDAEDAIKTLDEAHAMGFRVSADMIIGLPSENEQDIARLIAGVSGYVNHVSAYLLKVEEGTPLFRLKHNNEILIENDDRMADLYDFSVETLQKFGYMRYEISNFARAGEESIHNNIYWQMGEYFGAGAAAHAFIDGRRFYNAPNLKKYLTGFHAGNGHEIYEDSLFSLQDRGDEAVMLALRTRQGLNVSGFNTRFNADFYQKYAVGYQKMQKYLAERDGAISIQDKYLLLENEILTNLLQ